MPGSAWQFRRSLKRRAALMGRDNRSSRITAWQLGIPDCHTAQPTSDVGPDARGGITFDGCNRSHYSIRLPSITGMTWVYSQEFHRIFTAKWYAAYKLSLRSSPPTGASTDRPRVNLYRNRKLPAAQTRGGEPGLTWKEEVQP